MPRDLLKTAFQAVRFGCLFWAVEHYVVDLSMTLGPSMLPTLNESGDVILVDKLTPRIPEALGGSPIRRGDVIIADCPKDGSSKMVVKRVVGLPGDVITVAGGRYAPSTPYKGKTVKVPPGHVWIEGDNPLDSHDSRHYAAIPISTVVGRVRMRVWPLWDMRTFSADDPVPPRNTVWLQRLSHEPGYEAHRDIVWSAIAKRGVVEESSHAQSESNMHTGLAAAAASLAASVAVSTGALVSAAEAPDAGSSGDEAPAPAPASSAGPDLSLLSSGGLDTILTSPLPDVFPLPIQLPPLQGEEGRRDGTELQ